MRLIYLLLLVNTLFFMINAMENIPQKKVRNIHPAFHQYAHEMCQRKIPSVITGVTLLFFAWVLVEKIIHEC